MLIRRGSEKAFMCLVCCESIDNLANPPKKFYAKVLANKFRVFCKYVKLKASDNFDFLKEPFPFCKSCKPLVLKLFKYYQELRLANKRISKISCKVTAKMLESRDRVTIVPCDPPNFSQFDSGSLIESPGENVQNDLQMDQILDMPENLQQETLSTPESPTGKICRLRESIFNRYNAKVSLQKLEPSITTNLNQNLMSNDGSNSEIINEQDDENLMENSLLENMNSEDEPWSPFSLDGESFLSPEESEDENDSSLAQKSKRLFIKSKSDRRHTSAHTVEIDPNKFLYRNQFMFEKVMSQYKCSSCDFITDSRRSIVSHIRRQHLNSAVYVCETCGKNFAQKQLLKSHQETHSEVRSHLCHQCGQSFKTRPTLVKHMLRHREMEKNVKRFQCEECGQKFTQNKSLKLHKAIHSNDLPFECPECHKKFRQHAHLLRHQNTHVGAKPYACDQCGVKFTMKQSVLRHIQSVHNKIPRKSCPSKVKPQKESSSSSGHSGTSNVWTTNWTIAQPGMSDTIPTDLIIQTFRSEGPTATLVYMTP